jgi:hypothetical protein
MIFESTFPLLEKVEQNRLKSGAKSIEKWSKIDCGGMKGV